MKVNNHLYIYSTLCILYSTVYSLVICQFCNLSHIKTKKSSKSQHKNRASHSWPRCNGICLAVVFKYIWPRKPTFVYCGFCSYWDRPVFIQRFRLFLKEGISCATFHLCHQCWNFFKMLTFQICCKFFSLSSIICKISKLGLCYH